MPEKAQEGSRRSWRRAAAVLALTLLVAGASAAPGEEEILRQVKVDVFDQNWPAVLRGCEDLLLRFPGSPSGSQVEFYRARALSRLPGREAEALAAFMKFVERSPDDKILAEEAWASIFALACDPKRAPGDDCAATLKRGLASRSPYVSTLAAIRAGDCQDGEVRRKALATLKKAYEKETEGEIRNEILIAILKIDPKEVPQQGPQPPSRSSAPSRGQGGRKDPSLIRMTVFNKTEGRFELRVNLPVAFARALLDSLGEEERKELGREAKQEGIDLDNIFEAIQKSGAGKLLEVDSEDSRIEIWIE